MKEAEHGERVMPGHAYIAPGHSHLLLARTKLGRAMRATFQDQISQLMSIGAAPTAYALNRTMSPNELKALVEDKFVDSLRATAATMTIQELQDKRRDFVQAVQNAVAEDLEKNGLELESVSLTSLDQTDKQFFNPNNAFDAEGLTRLTEQTEARRKQRNDVEQDTAGGDPAANVADVATLLLQSVKPQP